MAPKSVLYLDSQQELCETFKQFLEKSGDFTVYTCDNPKNALKHISELNPDAVVSEIQMPDMDGTEFLRCLRDKGFNTPFIFFTKTCVSDQIIEALNSGADFYLKKGKNPKEQFLSLKEKIESAIYKSQMKTVLSETGPGSLFCRNPVPHVLVAIPEAVFVAVNDIFLQITGYTREEVVGKRAIDLGIFADENERFQLFSELEKNHYANGFELKIRSKSGDIRLHRIFSRIIMLGKKPYIFCTSEDITEKKETEMALNDEITRRRILQDRSRDGIVILKEDGSVFELNESFAKMLGYSVEEVKRMHVWDWNHHISEKEIIEVFRAADEKGENFETRHSKKDGSEIDVEISSTAAVISGKKLILCICRDITHHKRAEEALQIVNSKLNLLSHITCHEILNKTLAIKAFLSLLDDQNLEPEISDYLKDADLAISSIERQIKFTREYEKLGLNEPVWISIESLAKNLEDFRLKVDCDCSRVYIYADTMLEKVFQDLFDNTLRHAKEATRVEIKCRKNADSSLLITWEDDGKGIPDSQKEQIFKRGYGENTGFGLFLAREILGLTGIAITETGVYKKGVRFEILVPKGGYHLKKMF
ncbi:MAG: PAS domain S-box protein [Methanomicrobiaceae archaeon]|nr:PAS domain S-box protein [Methanomicrobiaceae archaeon]